VLDLTNWQLNLPINANGSRGSSTTSLTITQRSQPTPLSRFSLSPWFQTLTLIDNTNGEAGFDVVSMIATADGAKTSNNTKFARCEFREMNTNLDANRSVVSTNLAAWSFFDGMIHQMKVEQAVVRLSENRPRTVAGQIHDYKNDVFMLSIDGEPEQKDSSSSGDNNNNEKKRRANISAKFDNSAVTQVLIGDYKYVLGEFFSLIVTVDSYNSSSSSSSSSSSLMEDQVSEASFLMTVSVIYNGQTHSVTWTSFPNIERYNPLFESVYFKAGNYMQSNVVDYHERPDDFTEVWIRTLDVTHKRKQQVST